MLLLSVHRIGLRAEAAGSRAAALEVPSQSRGQERAEDNLGTPTTVSWMSMAGLLGRYTYLKVGRESHRRKTNLKV